jgi:AraC-like DNA-binding protein
MAESHTTDDGARLAENGIDLGPTVLSIEDCVAEKHIEQVAETDDLVVLRDSAGYELSEWADDLGMSRSALSERMHSLARVHYGRDETPHGGDPWSVNDPLVLAKEGDD